MERMRIKMAGKSDDEVRREAVAWANALVGYWNRVADSDPASYEPPAGYDYSWDRE